MAEKRAWVRPKISVGRHAGATSINIDSYHPLVADRVLHLLKRPGERADFGRAGREHVRKHFLFPRMLRDELRLIKELL